MDFDRFYGQYIIIIKHCNSLTIPNDIFGAILAKYVYFVIYKYMSTESGINPVVINSCIL